MEKQEIILQPKRGDKVYQVDVPEITGILKGIMLEDFSNDPPATVYLEDKDKLINIPYSLLRVKEN